MNAKTVLFYVVAILIASGIILASRQFAPGAKKAAEAPNALPDHITTVIATTLPKAVLQSRQQGKGGVRVADPVGNTIWISTDSVTSTTFVIRGTPPMDRTLQEGMARLQREIPSLTRARNLVVSEDLVGEESLSRVEFVLNETNYSTVSDLIYEISVNLFRIQSTTQWVIDLTAQPVTEV